MADVGTGTTIVFGTSGFTGSITNVAPSTATRPSFKTSHMGTTGRDTFIPGDLVDEGECTFDLWFDPNEQPPIDQAAETVTITFPTPAGGAAGATAAGTAFCTADSQAVPVEDLMTQTVTLKWSGAVTWTDST